MGQTRVLMTLVPDEVSSVAACVGNGAEPVAVMQNLT